MHEGFEGAAASCQIRVPEIFLSTGAIPSRDAMLPDDDYERNVTRSCDAARFSYLPEHIRHD
jgi:hypothetical protein